MAALTESEQVDLLLHQQFLQARRKGESVTFGELLKRAEAAVEDRNRVRNQQHSPKQNPA